MSRVSDAQLRFDAAAEEHEPSCVDDVRFVTTNPGADTERIMRRICRLCPLFAECGDLAAALRPQAGFWAGTQYDHARKAE